jgi:hypothetical protein
VSVSPNGEYFAVGHSAFAVDRGIIVFSMLNFTEVGKLLGHTNTVRLPFLEY